MTVAAESQNPYPVSPYTWLLKATLDQTTVASPTVRLASHTQPVTWQTKTYEPWSFSVAPFGTDTQGRRDTVEITLDNRSLEVGRWVAHGRGFRQMPFELYLIQLANLGEDAVLEFRGFLDEPVVTAEAVTLTIRQSKTVSRRWPWMRYVPGCHATYGDPSTCGYDGSLPSCAKTLTDCIAHGEDERTNNRAVIHPQRFHGFPGIPRDRR